MWPITVTLQALRNCYPMLSQGYYSPLSVSNIILCNLNKCSLSFLSKVLIQKNNAFVAGMKDKMTN